MRVLQGTVASIAVCLALAGCQDSDKEPTSGGSASGTSSPTTRPTQAPAASGPTIKGDTFTVNVPEGWTKNKDFSTDFLDQYARRDRGRTRSPSAEIKGEVRPLDEVAKDNFSPFSPTGTKRKRVADTTVAGDPAYHFTANAGFGDVDEAYGVVKDGSQVTIEFTLTGHQAGAPGGHRLGPGQLEWT